MIDLTKIDVGSTVYHLQWCTPEVCVVKGVVGQVLVVDTPVLKEVPLCASDVYSTAAEAELTAVKQLLRCTLSEIHDLNSDLDDILERLEECRASATQYQKRIVELEEILRNA